MKDLVLQDDLDESIQAFRDKFRRKISSKNLTEVYNTDQTGVQLEMISKRTLEVEGAKKVTAAAQKPDSITHSFTAQPVISAAGELLLPVFVTFHEPKVLLCFDEQMQRFRYIKAASSKSEKMSSHLAKEWLKEFKLQTPQKCDLLVDSWNGYTQAFSTETDITLHILPPKSTSVLQPLDVFFNRQFKAFYRILSDKIRRRYPHFKVSNRNGIGTLLQLYYCQMASKEFSNMIRYAWYKAGLIETCPPPFLTPVQYCFDLLTPSSHCGIDKCEHRAFIACANCEKYICFDHFVVDLHDCVDFLEEK
uniref:Transposase n=1 Tax=Panagrolaimus sp. PS1159 TaxID=55785 RepID=A0AC35F1R3_9BILA